MTTQNELYYGPKQYSRLNKQLSVRYSQQSILKSTRLKNWLSCPSSSNKVTFQFENELTMTKGEQNGVPGNKRSGMSPFIYTPEEFPEDAATQMIETTESGSKLKSKMYLLNGDEVPEQLMIWFEDFEDKIIKNVTLSSPAKLNTLRRLVNMKAQTIVSKTEEDFLRYAEPEDVLELQDYRIWEEIQAMTDA